MYIKGLVGDTRGESCEGRGGIGKVALDRGGVIELESSIFGRYGLRCASY